MNRHTQPRRSGPGLRGAVAVLSMVVGVAMYAAESGSAPAADGATGKPTNLSRLFGGASVQIWNASTGAFGPLPGLSSTIDDDVSSGWTPPVGTTRLLLTLAQDSDVSTVTLFAPGAEGSYTLYAADSAADLLDAAHRSQVLTSPLGTETSQPVSGVRAHYIMIELQVTKSAPIRSIDLVGRPLTAGVGQVTVVAPKEGEQNANKDSGQLTEVNFAADSLGAKIASGNTAFGKLIDGDTGTGTSLTSVDGKPASVSIQLAAAVDVDRISLAVGKVAGTIEVLATDTDDPNGRLLGSVRLDGTQNSVTMSTPSVNAEAITIVWTPDVPGTPLAVSEVGVFALAKVIRPDAPDGSSSVTIQPVVSGGGSPPPVIPPGKKPGGGEPPPPILPPAKQVSA